MLLLIATATLQSSLLLHRVDLTEIIASIVMHSHTRVTTTSLQSAVTSQLVLADQGLSMASLTVTSLTAERQVAVQTLLHQHQSLVVDNSGGCVINLQNSNY
jgi:hypothetical protein